MKIIISGQNSSIKRVPSEQQTGKIMDTLMMWRLIGAFVNVTVLSRGLQWLLRRWISGPYRRAVLVLALVTVIDFIGVWNLYGDPAAGAYIMLFYYIPLLLMWFLKDILDAAKQKRSAEGS
jgi:hypothetical protein